MLNSLGASSMASPAARYTAADAVEDQIADLQTLRRGRAAPKKHADAREQLHKGERLDQIIVGPEFQTLHAIIDTAPSAQNQNRRACLSVANSFEHLQTVHIRQHHVENDQVVIRRVHHVEGRLPVVRSVDSITGALESTFQKVSNSLFIFYDEKSHGAPP